MALKKVCHHDWLQNKCDQVVKRWLKLHNVTLIIVAAIQITHHMYLFQRKVITPLKVTGYLSPTRTLYQLLFGTWENKVNLFFQKEEALLQNVKIQIVTLPTTSKCFYLFF